MPDTHRLGSKKPVAWFVQATQFGHDPQPQLHEPTDPDGPHGDARRTAALDQHRVVRAIRDGQRRHKLNAEALAAAASLSKTQLLRILRGEMHMTLAQARVLLAAVGKTSRLNIGNPVADDPRD